MSPWVIVGAVIAFLMWVRVRRHARQGHLTDRGAGSVRELGGRGGF